MKLGSNIIQNFCTYMYGEVLFWRAKVWKVTDNYKGHYGLVHIHSDYAWLLDSNLTTSWKLADISTTIL